MTYTSREVYEFISTQTNDPIVERKTCAISGQEFAIYQSDLDFYAKISPTFGGQRFQIPTPNLCPEERQRRRMLFRNERKLYKRKCDFSGKDIISIYSPDKPYKVYDQKIRRSDDWNPMEYGREFNFLKTFAEQFGDLMRIVPRISNLVMNSENCDYNNVMGNSKNCYMCAATFESEDCIYSNRCIESKNALDVYASYQSENVYDIVNCNNSKNIFFSQNTDDAYNCSFVYNCKNCTDCFLCTNLINKQFCIFNQQYSETEYKNKIAEYKNVSFKDLLNKYKQLRQICSRNAMSNVHCNNCFASNELSNSSECKFCFNMIDGECISYCNDSAGDMKYSMDISVIGAGIEKMYEAQASGYGSYGGSFVNFCWTGKDLTYCDYCMYCSDCFGCIGLRNKQYCIFNKQYTKDAYETTVAKIIAHMQETGERGEFFHGSLSPFGYNETVAQEYFPLTREEALTRGYTRQDNNYDPVIPAGANILDWKVINDVSINDDEILKSIFLCEVSSRPYRIIKQELEFYRKHHLPLPRKHPDVRHQERMNLRPGRTLYLRNCDKTGEQILSVYPPDYPGKVYSEKAYLAEVY